MHLFEKRLQAACLLLCALIIAASLFTLKPHWGLMDDASLVYELIPRMEAGGIFLQAWIYGVGDISWGMFRPIYPLMAYFLYKPGMATQPWVTFGLTAMFSGMILFGYSYFFSRILKIRWQSILLINAAFFYQYDFLQHPSLQEKIVLLFGLGYFYAAWFAPKSWILFLTLLFATLGFASKASFLIYFGAGYLILSGRLLEDLKSRDRRSFLILALNLLLGLLAVYALGKIASQGSYTAQYSLLKIAPNLFSIHGVIFLVPILGATWMFLWKWRTLLEAPQLLAPLAGIVLYLCIFLPWGIGGYIQSISGPLIAAIAAQLAVYYLNPRMQSVFFSGFAVLAVLVCAYRVPTFYLRLSDLGAIVAKWDSISSRGEVLNMPCFEGSASMKKYFSGAGHKNSEVVLQSDLSKIQSGVWLFDDAMCPMPGRKMNQAGCEEEILYQSIWQKSYRVVRLKCES